MVQPPLWIPMSSAAAPTTWILPSGAASGRRSSRFWSSTTDSRTACRATARCASEPKAATCSGSADQSGSNSPAANLTRRIRRTASSMRDMGMEPSSTNSVSVRTNSS